MCRDVHRHYALAKLTRYHDDWVPRLRLRAPLVPLWGDVDRYSHSGPGAQDGTPRGHPYVLPTGLTSGGGVTEGG